jgi:hypothetical protein
MRFACTNYQYDLIATFKANDCREKSHGALVERKTSTPEETETIAKILGNPARYGVC